MSGYPIELNLNGRTALVVGLGPVGRRKARSLAASGARCYCRGSGRRVVAVGSPGGNRGRDSGLRCPSASGRLPRDCRGSRRGQPPGGGGRSPAGDLGQLDERSGGRGLHHPRCLDVGPAGADCLDFGASPALARALRDRAALALGPAASGLAELLAELRPVVREQLSDPAARRRIFRDWAHPRWLALWQEQGPDAVRRAPAAAHRGGDSCDHAISSGRALRLAGWSGLTDNAVERIGNLTEKKGRVVKIAVIGTGYVGLVRAPASPRAATTSSASTRSRPRSRGSKQGEIPIYEPGLSELVHRNHRDGRLRFTTNLPEGIAEAELVFIAVGTPQGDDGGADLRGIWAVGQEIAEHLDEPKIDRHQEHRPGRHQRRARPGGWPR